MEKLNQRSEELKKTLKTDSFLLQNERLQSLEDQIQALLFPQDLEEGKATPKSNLIAALKPIQEMGELCQATRFDSLKFVCQLKWRNEKRNLDYLEKELAEGPSKPEPALVFKDVSPRLRCFFKLPETDGAKPKYHLSDPTGRYRYADMKKTSLGDYALDVAEDRIFQTDDAKNFQINKEFKDAQTGKSYEAYITSNHGFSTGPKSKCSVEGISINLSFDDGTGNTISSAGSFNLNRDKPFDATFSFRKDTSDGEFRVNCAIASKMRTGGWLFSDSVFVNPSSN